MMTKSADPEAVAALLASVGRVINGLQQLQAELLASADCVATEIDQLIQLNALLQDPDLFWFEGSVL